MITRPFDKSHLHLLFIVLNLRCYFFKADTVESLVKQLKAFTGCDDDQNLLLNSCDTLGRLDIQTMEDANGMVASESDIEAFKKSEKRLWLCCYTFNIELVQSAVVDLSAAT